MAAKKKQEDKEIKSRKLGPETKNKAAGTAANTSPPKKQAAEALQNSEDRYRTLVEKAFEGIIVIQDGEIVFANPRAYAIIGHPRDQVAPRAFMDFIHPDDAEILTDNYLRRLKGEQFEETYTIRLVDQKGNIKWAQISTSLINWEGKPATLTFLTDVTERNRVEKALLFTRFSLDNAADTMVCVDREAHFIDVNETFCRACGYSREELLSMRVHDLDPDYSAEVWPEFWEKLKQSGSLIFETYHRSKKGELYPVEISARYFEQDGKEYHTAVARDVTERKKAEKALALSEERYRTILENMQDSYFEVDLTGNFTFVNDATCRNLGYTMEELIGQNFSIIAPGQDAVKAIFEAYNRVYKTGDPYMGFAFKAIRKDGSAGYAEVSISLIKNAQGRPIGFRGVGRDVTERKQMEQKLEEMATHDFLTGLPNRVLLLDRFNIVAALAHRNKARIAVMSLDLDNFKSINDTLGHDIGDQVLKAVSTRFTGIIRASDTVARVGGDEFMLVMLETKHMEDATAIAQKIRDSFIEPLSIDGHQLYLSSSIGIAIYPEDAEDMETLIRKSDAAMYYSKGHGGNQFNFCGDGYPH